MDDVDDVDADHSWTEVTESCVGRDCVAIPSATEQKK